MAATLSNDNGGAASANKKAALLALMSPSIRTFFDDKVEPLLNLMRYQEELAQKEQRARRWQSGVKDDRAAIVSAQSQLAKHGAEERPGEEKLKKRRRRWKDQIRANEQAIRTRLEKLEKTQAAAAVLRGKVHSQGAKDKTRRALVAFQAPLICPPTVTSTTSTASAASTTTVPPNVTTISPPPVNMTNNSSSSVQASGKKQRLQEDEEEVEEAMELEQKAAPNATSCVPFSVAGVVLNLSCLATIVLDFLNSKDGLNLGLASHATEEAVNESLPCLRLAPRSSSRSTPAPSFSRIQQRFRILQHLELHANYHKSVRDWLGLLIGARLNLQLHCFKYDHFPAESTELFLSVEWPELRQLILRPIRSMDAFYEQRRPPRVFPLLESFGVNCYTMANARGLAGLINDGAFPALRSIVNISQTGRKLSLSGAFSQPR